MLQLTKELNNDQLDGLANLCFDLAKGAFIITLFPAPNVPRDPLLSLAKVFIAFFLGLAFTYTALVVLKAKEGTRR